jgi:UDP-hydrolysing UDP-N-acetyl-D-glucosamine 2-epimerase
MPRRICIPLTTRGNYAKMKSTMRALADDGSVELCTIIGGPLLDAGYGDYAAIIEADGFTIDDRLDYLDTATDLAGMTRSAGACLLAMQAAIARHEPDWVMIVADRYEALALAQAALCMNVRIAHLEGGEVSGSIDERIRHAITKLAHLHFPANRDAAARIERMGEVADSIVTVGTPSLDLIAAMDLADLTTTTAFLAAHGIGRVPDLTQPFAVVSFHPVVTEYGAARTQYAELAEAVRGLGLPTIWLLPNLDAGAHDAVDSVATLRDDPAAPPAIQLGSAPIGPYATLLAHAACLIGNSSSGLREGAFLGTPVVNIGSRQTGRARAANVRDVGHDATAILGAARAQIDHGRYTRDTLYGDGKAGEKIAAALASRWPAIDKTITY